MEELLNHILSCFCLFVSLSFGPTWEPLGGPRADRPELKLEWIWKMFHRECQRLLHSTAASLVMPLRLLLVTAFPCFSPLPSFPLLTPSSRSTSSPASLKADQSLAPALPAFQESTGVFSFSLFLSGVEKASDGDFKTPQFKPTLLLRLPRLSSADVPLKCCCCCLNHANESGTRYLVA